MVGALLRGVVVKMIRVFDKDGLYKRTGWFSKDCETLVKNLAEFGLVIVKKSEVDTVNEAYEDDMK